MSERKEFSQTRFILAEGFDDRCFASALVKCNQWNQRPWDISANEELGKKTGKDGFEDSCVGSEPVRGFADIKDIVIMTDNDDDPDASFNNVKAQLERAKALSERDWGVPDAPGEKCDGDPSVAVWMFPEPGTPGCLETLLWRVIRSKYSQKADCVDKACNCVEIQNWPAQRLDKARVKSFIALSGKPNRLDYVWRDSPDFIPIHHREFRTIANFLRGI